MDWCNKFLNRRLHLFTRKANEPFRAELKREQEELEKLRKEVEKNKRFREALKKVPSLQSALKQDGLL